MLTLFSTAHDSLFFKILDCIIIFLRQVQSQVYKFRGEYAEDGRIYWLGSLGISQLHCTLDSPLRCWENRGWFPELIPLVIVGPLITIAVPDGP